jgi:hypothetical protein
MFWKNEVKIEYERKSEWLVVILSRNGDLSKEGTKVLENMPRKKACMPVFPVLRPVDIWAGPARAELSHCTYSTPRPDTLHLLPQVLHNALHFRSPRSRLERTPLGLPFSKRRRLPRRLLSLWPPIAVRAPSKTPK